MPIEDKLIEVQETVNNLTGSDKVRGGATPLAPSTETKEPKRLIETIETIENIIPMEVKQTFPEVEYQPIPPLQHIQVTLATIYTIS